MSRPVAQFALTGLAVLLLVGLVAVQILRATGRSEAIADAREVTRLAGQGIVAGELRPGIFSGDPQAIAHLDEIVRTRVLRAPVVRVKLWDASGRILYSDQRELIGRHFPLARDELEALRSGHPISEVSDLAKSENRFERRFGQLLEVYLGIGAPGGRRVLFETYQSYSSVSASGRRLWLRFAPALVGALVLLYLVQLPLALSLVRRLRRGQQEREQLLHRTLDASAAERRRVAQDLHDGVVQSLAGVSFGLAAATEGLEHGVPRAAVEEAAAETRRAIRQLRTLLVDIYPPSLEREGLHAALSDLLTPLAGHGVETHVDVAPSLHLAPELQTLLYRTAQEAVRNAADHGDPRSVSVRASASDGKVLLEVADDGRGFAVGEQAGRPGHFGLRLVREIVAEAGGTMDVRSAPGEGTTVSVEVPFA
jgi:two-component system, NarL family, sensor kinase